MRAQTAKALREAQKNLRLSQYSIDIEISRLHKLQMLVAEQLTELLRLKQAQDNMREALEQMKNEPNDAEVNFLPKSSQAINKG